MKGEWPSGLRCCVQIRWFLVQAQLGTRSGLGTQPCYEALGDLLVKHRQNAVIKIR